MAIEIVDFPMNNGGSFHCFLLTFTRGYSEMEVAGKIKSRHGRPPNHPWFFQSSSLVVHDLDDFREFQGTPMT